MAPKRKPRSSDPGRPFADPSHRRDHVLTIRVSADERELLGAAAEAKYGADQRGVVTTWAREVLLRAAKAALRGAR